LDKILLSGEQELQSLRDKGADDGADEGRRFALKTLGCQIAGLKEQVGALQKGQGFIIALVTIQ
jgi:hypothetical protein